MECWPGDVYVGYLYLEPVNVLYFGASTLQKKAFSNQNKGHLGSRYSETCGKFGFTSEKVACASASVV